MRVDRVFYCRPVVSGDRVGGGSVLEVLPGDSSCSTGTSCCCIIGENILNEFQGKKWHCFEKKGGR